MSPARAATAVSIIGVLLALSTPATAQFVVVRAEGEAIEPLGLVPVEKRDAVRKLTGPGAVQVGFVYEYASLYTLKVWTTNGRYCLYSDSEYWVVTKEAAAELLGVGTEAVSTPLAYMLPTGLVVIVLGALLVGMFRLYGKRWVEYLEARFPPDATPSR